MVLIQLRHRGPASCEIVELVGVLIEPKLVNVWMIGGLNCLGHVSTEI